MPRLRCGMPNEGQKSTAQRSVPHLLRSALLVALLVLACNPPPRSSPTPAADRVDLISASVDANRVEGAPFPAVEFDREEPFNEEDEPFVVPVGPDRGEKTPLNDQWNVQEIPEEDLGNENSQEPVVFRDYGELSDATPTAHLDNPEPSVAENGQTIMTTGNFWMSLSTDGGSSFTTVNPTTIFPQDYGGFCCDQVATYVPEFDLFVWLLQYRSQGGTNAIRVAAQTTDVVRSSSGQAWTYWDFTNVTFASSGALDYNDMSFGSRFLYWSSSVGGGSNRYVVRVPLEEMRNMGSVNFQYTGSTAAFWSHVTQNGADGVYWAGHVNNSTMTVFSMMDADGFYSWRDVPIDSWPSGSMSSTAADGTDWLLDASWKTYVRAAAVRGDSLYFAWNAPSGDGFPQVHVQIVEINRSTFALVGQMQIWNPDFAFAYPYFETNSEGELGMIVAFGGGPFDASSGVGVWGDFVIYYPRLSDSSRDNYGHYHTARRSGSDGSQWVAAGYSRAADGSVLPYYIRYSR